MDCSRSIYPVYRLKRGAIEENLLILTRNHKSFGICVYEHEVVNFTFAESLIYALTKYLDELREYDYYGFAPLIENFIDEVREYY